MHTRSLAVSATSIVIGATFAVVQSPAIATPVAPGPTIALPSLTTTSVVPGAGTGGPGTAALNSVVSTACNSGNPLGGQQWYTLPTGDLGEVYAGAVAHKQDPDTSDGGELGSTALAIVDYTTNTVLGCSSNAAVSHAITASDNGAIVVYWDQAELRGCRTDPNAACDFGTSAVELFVNNSNGAPANDQRSTAAAITALPYNDTVNGLLSPPGDGDPYGDNGPVGYSNCGDPLYLPQDTGRVFWTYTASSTGDLPVSVDIQRTAPPDNAPLFYPWIGVKDLTADSDVYAAPCGGDPGPVPVTLNHNYLIEVSNGTPYQYVLSPVSGGQITLHIGPIGTPVAPVDLTAADNGSLGVTVSWSAPASSVNGYVLTRDGEDSHGNGPQVIDAAGDSTGYTWSNLLAGQTYTFTVKAHNASGYGPPASVVFMVGRPGPPTNITSSVSTTAHSATLNWQPPTATSGQSVTGYRVSRTGNDTANTGPFSTTLPATARSETFTNMLPGSSYVLSVQAVTGGGTSDPATATAAFPGPPVEPSAVSATFSSTAKTGTIHWSPPLNNGGSAVTGYRVSRDGTDSTGLSSYATTVASTVRSFTFSHLNAWETYTLTVQAINALGTGLGYPVKVTFTANTPGPPTGVTATRGNHTATVVWTTPTQTGGSPITGYRIRRFAGTSTTVQSTVTVGASTHSYTATGLTNGSSYSFDITATNSHGTGANSTRSNAVTPATVPNAPTIGSASAGTAGAPITATARWSAPSVTGGSPITGYKVTALRMSSTGTVLATTVSSVLGSTLRSFTMTLPVVGNYRFTVQAINAVGGSTQSARSNLVAGQ